MKKLSILCLVIVLVLSLALVSCDDTEYDGSDSNSCSHGTLSGASVVKDATCTATGLIGGTCSSCGSYATQSFNAYGHNFVDGMCTVCGASK